MNASQDDSINSINTVTAAQLKQVADSGIWASSTTVNPEAANVGQALVATLKGEAARTVLTPDLRQLTDSVLRLATVKFPRIEVPDGIRLSAHTIKHNTADPRPVVIVPAGWTPFGWVLFEYAHLQLALRGYHVLAYTPRGIGYPGFFWTSDGTIDVAGEKDWTDGSALIDYAQEYFQPSSVAFFGESYGSGISQLVAAHDPDDRVKAVVALSTWGNLATSLLHNDTRHLAAVNALISFTGGPAEDKFDEPTRRILRYFDEGEHLDEVRDWGQVRAPELYLRETNERGIPTFFSNTWHETLFPVNQVLETFDGLTVPKRLNLWIGDHAAPEGAGLSIPFSGPNPPVAEAFAWLDHHLLGVENGVRDWPEVNAQVMFTYRTRTDPGTGKNEITEPARREPLSSWDEVTTSVERWNLTDTIPGDQDGALAAAAADATDAAGDWSRDFTAGHLTDATAVDAVMTTGQAEWQGNPKDYDVATFQRPNLLIWTTDALAEDPDSQVARRIRGVPRVHLTVRNTADRTTLVAYLFDVAEDDTARIITHEPYTLTDLTPDQDTSIAWELQAASYDLPANHRLALVINSRDDLYSYATVENSITTISSSGGDAAYLELPLG